MCSSFPSPCIVCLWFLLYNRPDRSCDVCEAVVCFAPPSSQEMEPPPLLVYNGTWLVGWLAVGFLGCLVDCSFVGLWGGEFGWLAGWLIDWLVGRLMCG